MSYIRCSILGASPGGEVWSINPVFDPTGEFPGPVDQSSLDDAAEAIAGRAPGTQLLGFLSTALSITGVRLEARDDLTDDLLSLSIYTKTAPLNGTTTPLRSAQDALVVSLRTNTPGASGRGRLYWPAVGSAVDGGLRFSDSAITNALSEMATYLHAIETDLNTAFAGLGFDLAVRSRATKTTPHVNQLRIGNVPDVQRRRRDSLIENYQSAPF